MASGRAPLLVCASLLLALAVVCGANKDDDYRMVDRIVRQLMRCSKIPSLSLAMISLEDVASYNKGYYDSRSSGTRPSTHSSVYCIGGGTQAFTAVLLAKLIDENENVTWNTPVQDILGRRLGLPDLYRSDNLNLRDILAMRSGLAGMEILPIAKPFDREKLVRRLVYAPRVAGFREKYVHNEVLFALIEDLIQELGGDSWQNLLQLHILQPLRMASTKVIGDTDDVDLANPAVSANGVPVIIDIDSHSGLEVIAPAAGLCTSADDMSKWFRFLLTSGRDSRNEQLVRKEALEYTFKPIQSRGNGGDPVTEGYRKTTSYFRDQNALGWIRGHYRGSPFISQDGSLPGYQSLSTILPDRRIAVHVAFSGGNSPRAFAAKTLLNIIALDHLMKDHSSSSDHNICDRLDDLEKQHPKVKKSSYPQASAYQGDRDLNDFAGYYRNYAFGDINIRFNESESEDLLMDYGMASYKLAPTYENDTFAMIAQPGPLWYSTNTDMTRGRLFAVFSTHPLDAERVETVTIAGFDRNIDPQFSRDPQRPRVEGRSEPRCGACNIVLSVWCLAVLSVSLFFR
ncbi:uncharacterized protein LOC101854816 [Aplysia californica]|uniref:Uncharacterized protein LOC101854816 n=1 Tax=Aplysia californica TaxID=6500 RepID=A0ABM1A6L6_APLCA|nr:uncharacterized protein LOC101854816 [Aplysia californica]